MAVLQSQLVVAFAQALTELVTVEKKNIVALTEIARDALRTEPQSAPSLAALITHRIVQAAPPEKLPVLYLLDSISKLVGEPYKTLFAPSLPEAFMSAWQLGGPGLHRPLDKLLGTWSGVFPSPLLADIHGRVAALRAAHAPQLVQPAPVPMNGIGSAPGFGYGALAPVQALGPPPMAADPRLALQSAAAYSHHAAPHPPGYQQPPSQYQQASAAAPMHAAQPAASRVDVNGLLASLVDSGLLAAPGAQHSAAAAGFEPPPHQGSGALATPQYVVATTPPHAPAARATPEREQPASTHFTPDRLKEPNPSAVARLLRQTEATKSRFLDRKFLRRQQRAAGAAARASRLWYVDLDTWMASTVGAAPSGAATAGRASAAAPGQGAAAVPARENCSVPVDDSQPCCALSGEQFEQFWDEDHQEWRYRDAIALDAEEAASYGLQEGAIVLVSALGKPDSSVLQQGAAPGRDGVVAELHARQEIEADLAVATAADGLANSVAVDVKPGLKHAAEEDLALAAEGEGPQEKRARTE